MYEEMNKGKVPVKPKVREVRQPREPRVNKSF